MDNIYNNIGDYNPKRERNKLINLDEKIADINTNKKSQVIVKELLIRCRKLNISLVFIKLSCFLVKKKNRLNFTHYLIMRIGNKIELENFDAIHSADIDYKDFITIYSEYTSRRYSFLTS